MIMVDIKVKKGLKIPIEGGPTGAIQNLIHPHCVALNLQPFNDLAFRLLVKPGDVVKIGTPLVEDKQCPGRFFVSPAAGLVKDILRGEKRRPHNIVIELSRREEHETFPELHLETVSRPDLISYLLRGGLFSYIRSRPFNLLANPEKSPRSIFVKALESAPFSVCAKMQLEGHEQAFAVGLKALKKLTDGPVHLVHRKNSTCRSFTEAEGVVKHTAEGPHPVSNASLHIHLIDPIQKPEDVVWTVSALDVVRVGHLIQHRRIHNERVISIAGSSILPDKRGYYRVRDGTPVSHLIADRLSTGFHRLISGDVLMGDKVEPDAYLGFYHTAFCAIPESYDREFLHFFRLGLGKYTASGAYVTGHLDNTDRKYRFNTSLHGEHRAFVTNVPYDRVMPMRIPTLSLVKAVMAEDFEQAVELGLLEVDSEDFALATFVCPSKIEMTEIMRKGLRDYAAEVLV